MENAVEIFVIINLLVVGASHFFQADVWVVFFKKLSGYGSLGSFINGFISLSFGSIIVAFHWVWEGVVPTIITCFGIIQVLKSAICFIAPQYGLKSISSPKAQNPNSYRVGGVVLFVLGCVFLLAHIGFL